VTFPSVVVGLIVSWGDNSFDSLDSKKMLLIIRSILLLSARNSWLQWYIDLCTAKTKHGNTSQDSAKTAAPITLRMPMIPRSAIIRMRSSSNVFCTDGLLSPRLSGLHIPRTALHALQVFAKKVSIYENDTTRHSHMQVGSFHLLTN